MALEGITFGEQKPVCASCNELRARLESVETALRRLANPDAPLHDVGKMSKFAESALAALAEVGQERPRLVCSACGRDSDMEPRGGLCGMPRPPLGICCGRFRVALGAVGEEKSDARSV